MRPKRPNRVRGPEHDQFWGYCNKGEFRLQRCVECRQIAWPAVKACENCGNADLTWERLSGRGKIISWCTFERQYYKELPVPWDTILVELEEGPLFISNPKGITGEEIRPNQPVKLDFIECQDDAGDFRLPVFQKA